MMFGFPGRYDEAEARRTAANHSFDEILADRARAFAAVFAAAANRQQLFRKCEWLNATTYASRGHDSPHSSCLSNHLLMIRSFERGHAQRLVEDVFELGRTLGGGVRRQDAFARGLSNAREFRSRHLDRCNDVLGRARDDQFASGFE